MEFKNNFGDRAIQDVMQGYPDIIAGYAAAEDRTAADFSSYYEAVDVGYKREVY